MQTTQVLDGRYEIGPVLGEGGMARVHRGLDRQLHRPVAVKILAPPFDRDRGFVERFRREARAAAGLSHPNIVAVFDTGSDDGTHYIVTELVEGETLAERIGRDAPLEPDAAVAIAIDVARALASAHDRGVIHRDVKPANVMLTHEGTVKVVDLGIAHVAGSDTLTGTGVVLGSSSYLSPEQANGEPGDARSDIYALGCVLYEMLTGRVPFRADTPVATMYRHVNDDPAPPSSVRAVPAALEAIVMRCLAKDPRRRFAAAADLERAFVRALARPTTTAPLPAVGEGVADTRPITRTRGPIRPPWYRRIPVRWVVATGVIAVLGVTAFALASTTGELRPRQAAREAQRNLTVGVPESTPAAIAAAWTGLIDEIASGAASGEIDERFARTLAARSVAVLDAYGAGAPSRLESALRGLEEEVAAGVESRAISADAAAGIELSIVRLLDALQEDGALGDAASPQPAEDGDEPEETGSEENGNDGGGSGGGGNGGGGPPEHANNDKDEDG